MNQVFRVAVHYESDNGYIQYDPATKTAAIELANPGKCREVMEYLTSTKTLRAARHTLVDFEEWQAIPTESLEYFKVALSRLWETTGVHIDWSRPV